MVTLNAEALLSGIDLSAHDDSADAPEVAEYDRLRALDAGALAAAFEADWPRIARGLTLDGAGAPALVGVAVGEEPDPALPRDAVVTFEAAMEGASVRVGWAPAYGELILREVSEGGEPFAGILAPGELSPPLEARGGDGAGAALLDGARAGFERAVPGGAAHVLLLVGLFLHAPGWRPVLAQVAAFASAGGAALALGGGAVPAGTAGLLVALSLVWIGLGNVFGRGGLGWGRIAAVLAAGAVHGLAFAPALEGAGPSPAGFALGVGAGQVAVIGAGFALLALPPRRRAPREAHAALSQPASYAIAAIGLWWALERALLA